MTRARRRSLLVLGAALLMAGAARCAGNDMVTDTLLNVVTLQRGTTSDLKDRRGQGPFHDYPEIPAAMLAILEEAMGRAGGPAGSAPFVDVYRSDRYGEVVAKEREVEGASYGEPFRSAAIAIVHPSPKGFAWCRVEMHAVQRGPFHKGRVCWARDLPHLIQEVRREVGRAPPATHETPAPPGKGLLPLLGR